VKQSAESVAIASATETIRVSARMRGDIDGKKARAYRGGSFKMTWLGSIIGFFCVMIFIASPVWLGIAGKMYDRYDT
jgi:hypothetical protein